MMPKKYHPQVVLETFDSGFASAEEASKLAIKDGSPVWRIVNLLQLDGRCVMVDQITLDKKRFKNYLKKNLFIAKVVFISYIRCSMVKLLLEPVSV